MFKKKLPLDKLKLKSFVTALEQEITDTAKGGSLRDCDDIPHTDPRICGGWTAGPTCTAANHTAEC